ncbi:peroxiredoxin-like family protein [Zhouia amylolytica]|nr:peroxiredoxin-like family protein [Zhouia amylolytica]
MKYKLLWMLIAFVAISFNSKQLNAQNIKYDKYGMEAVDAPMGLALGNDAPQITLTMPDGSKTTLKDLYTEQPIVIIFYRGYWCPICNRYLADFAKNASEIEKRGAKIIAITPQDYENIGKTMEKNETDFLIISDTDAKIMKAFDVDFNVTEDYQGKVLKGLNTSISETNASNQAILPVPATYIINTKGKIVYRQFDPDYRNRASVKEILANLPQ